MIRGQGRNWISLSAQGRGGNAMTTMSSAHHFKSLKDETKITTEEIVNWAVQLIRSNERGYICAINFAVLNMMHSNEHLRRFVQQAALVLADSQCVVWGSRLFSQVLPKRLASIDLIKALATRAEQEKIGIYLIGATSELIIAMTNSLRSQYPQLKICGYDNGNGSFDSIKSRVAAIRLSGAQILLVAGRVSCSEQFLSEHWTELGVNLAIDVGHSFNRLVNRNGSIPIWIQEMGLEWLYRLLQEPHGC